MTNLGVSRLPGPCRENGFKRSFNGKVIERERPIFSGGRGFFFGFLFLWILSNRSRLRFLLP